MTLYYIHCFCTFMWRQKYCVHSKITSVSRIHCNLYIDTSLIFLQTQQLRSTLIEAVSSAGYNFGVLHHVLGDPIEICVLHSKMAV